MSLAAIILIAWCGLSLIAVGVSLIFIFEKAGQNGIDALIPGKNSVTTARITATKAPVTGAVHPDLLPS